MARILLVEDDADVREVLGRSLARAGHRVIARRTGDEALRAHRAEPADLVVMDLCTPGLSGLGALAAMREAGDETPVLAISGAITLLDGPEPRPALTAALDCGADAVLAKPFRRATLLDAIARLIDLAPSVVYGDSAALGLS